MKHFPIILKFLAIMGLFGIFALGAAWFATSRILLIDREYSMLLSGPAHASLLISRANENFETARDGIAEIVISTTTDANTLADTTYQAGSQDFASNMDAAAMAAPGYAARRSEIARAIQLGHKAD